MEAPNNDAANTLLKRPRLAQCGVATVLYLVLHRFQKPFPLCIVSVSNDRHYTGYVSSRYCQAGPSPPRARHGLHTITPLHQPSRITVHAICTASQALLMCRTAVLKHAQLWLTFRRLRVSRAMHGPSVLYIISAPTGPILLKFDVEAFMKICP